MNESKAACILPAMNEREKKKALQKLFFCRRDHALEGAGQFEDVLSRGSI